MSSSFDTVGPVFAATQHVALITSPEATAVIGCAMKVHSAIGPGVFESVYEECVAHELRKAGLSFKRQVTLPLTYDGIVLPRAYSADLIVENAVLVELKCVDTLLPIHSAQVLTYLRLSGLEKGLLINFCTTRLKDGIKSILNRRGALPEALPS